jgi:hypothetical protein
MPAAKQLAEKWVFRPSGVKTPEENSLYVVAKATTHKDSEFFRSL